MYLPAPKHILHPKFDVSTPNAVHQADLLFLPRDTLGHGRGRKTFKYALTVVHVASRFKEAKPLTSKESTEVAKTFEKIYKRGPLKWPQLLQVDPGREFMGDVTKEMKKIILLLDAGALKFTEIRLLLKDSTALWLNACSDISMQSKCGILRGSGVLNGSKAACCCFCFG